MNKTLTPKLKEVFELIKEEIDCGRNPSPRLMAKILHNSETTIRNHMAKLQDVGVIQIGDLCKNVTIPDQLTRIERLENSLSNLIRYISDQDSGSILEVDDMGVLTVRKIVANASTFAQKVGVA